MINRIEEIHKKGFSINTQSNTSASSYVPTNYGKLHLGNQTIDDATLNIGSYYRLNQQYGDKDCVLQAINSFNLPKMRAISNFYYKTSGIYSRLLRYIAYLHRYDWMITPEVNRGLAVIPGNNNSELKELNKNQYLESFFKILRRFDEFGVKKFCGDVALKVLRNGCYYGYYTLGTDGSISIQELPPNYCRSRFKDKHGNPIVQFNMGFFDDVYATTELRTKILNMFPSEFKKGYRAYKQGKLRDQDYPGDTIGWYILNPQNTVKFNINEEDYPVFISAIPTLIDLDTARELDQKRMAQKLLRIIVQKMPLDKNGELIFDVDEAQALHNNAVKMLTKAIGVDVLTTFADVEVADMSDKSNTTQSDDVTRVKNSVFDEFGTSINNFNSTSNNALKYSVLNDASSMQNLIEQFQQFLNRLLKPYNTRPQKCYYTAQILPTTNDNYQDLSKLYKEQTQSGFSKMLPQIALGQSQSSILATAYWENEILDLVEVFVPPITSATMNADTLTALTGKGGGAGESNGSPSQPNISAGNQETKTGRPEKAEQDRSDKTQANRESL